MDWVKQVRPSQIPYIIRVLWRTQRMMKPAEYMKEYRASCPREQGVPHDTLGLSRAAAAVGTECT